MVEDGFYDRSTSAGHASDPVLPVKCNSFSLSTGYTFRVTLLISWEFRSEILELCYNVLPEAL